MDGAARPAFYFDLGSPEAYLSAERVLQVMPVAAEWVPVLAADCPAATPSGPSAAPRSATIALARASSARAAARGLQPAALARPVPVRQRATRCGWRRTRGRSGAPSPFALAAFRQAFAGGRVARRSPRTS